MEYKPSDWDYLTSTVCNAHFSGMTFEELIDCVMMSANKEELDAAVTATLGLKEIVSYEK